MLPPERDVFKLLRKRAAFRYESAVPIGRASVFHADMRGLPKLASSLRNKVICAVTSPPYFDVTDFEEDQWLRLWFLGGRPYPSRGIISRDDRHGFADKYWSFVADLWRTLDVFIVPRGNVVIRVGSKRINTDGLTRGFLTCSRVLSRSVALVSAAVSELRKRQTDAFRPGSEGVVREVDLHFVFNA